MRRTFPFALLLPFVAGCSGVHLPRLAMPHVRPYERVAPSRAEPATGWPETLAVQTQRSREADEGARGAALLPPRALQDSRIEFVQQRDDGPTRVVDGSALLLRSGFGERYSATLEAGREQVRDSSIDLLALAGGTYRENRTRYGLELATRARRARYSLAIGRDAGDDDATKRLRVGVAQGLFGDSTRLGLRWERSTTDLERRNDPTFRGTSQGRGYAFALSHLLTPRLEVGATLEGRVDSGFLADPYRSVRYLDATAPGGASWQPERLPTQHSSDALSIRGRYRLAERSTAGIEYRYYRDNWRMAAHTLRADWQLPIGEDLLLETGLRHHRQQAAWFHEDLLPVRGAADGFYSRNPALSALQDSSLSLGLSWRFLKTNWHGLEGGTLVGTLEHRRLRHQDLRDAREGSLPGSEPWFRPKTTQIQVGIAMTF